MRRKLTALLLSVVLCLSLIATTAFAADAEDFIYYDKAEQTLEHDDLVVGTAYAILRDGSTRHILTIRENNRISDLDASALDTQLTAAGSNGTVYLRISTGNELPIRTEKPTETAAINLTIDGTGSGKVTINGTERANGYSDEAFPVGDVTVAATPDTNSTAAVKVMANGSEVTLDASGKFTAVKDTTYDITVTFTEKTAEIVDVTGVTLSPTSLTLTVGSSSTLTATVLPANATNKNVTWSSSDTSVVTVVNGRVTALKAGTATITVTTVDGGKTATCTVTVTAGGTTPVDPDRPGGGSSGGGSHGGNVGKPAVVGGNQSSGGNQGGETTGAFSDVQSGAYYADAVQWAVNQGITTGTTSTTFSPNNPCTRAQIVTFLWRANGSPAATGSNPFTDVAQDAYYYDAVLWAVEKGITTGTTATTFSPNNTCTRAQAVTFLHRSAGTPAAGGTNPFTDVGTGAYYTNAVLWAVEKGVTSGTTATTFSPNSTCTRAQIVTFLYRAQ